MLGLAVATIAAAGVVRIAPGWRPDIRLGHPAFIAATRTALLGLAAVPLVMAAIRAARPGAPLRTPMVTGLLVLAVLPCLALCSLATAPSAMREWQAALPELAGSGQCVVLALASAIPALLVLTGWTRRYGAVTAPGLAGRAAGLAAGVLGCAVYSLTCPSEHWLFAGLVYPAAIAVIAVLAGMVTPRFLRW